MTESLEVSDERLNRILTALLVADTAETARMYLNAELVLSRVEDLPAYGRAIGRVIGGLRSIILTARDDPSFLVPWEDFIHALALAGPAGDGGEDA